MTTTITVHADGPLQIEGDIRIVGAAGQELPVEGEAWLCRCGHSANKPFCDGSHATADFQDHPASD